MREFGRVAHAVQQAGIEIRLRAADAKVTGAAHIQQVDEGQRSQRDRDGRAAQLRVGRLVVGREAGAPVHIHIRIDIHLPIGARGHHHELFLGQQFAGQARALRRVVQHGQVQRAVVHGVEQARGTVDLGPQGDLGAVAAHAYQPVAEQRLPQAQFAADADGIVAPRRQGHLVARPFPHLHHGGRVAHEALAGRRQACARLVAHEQLAPQLLLQGADAGADGRLRHVHAFGRHDEAAAGSHFQKGTRLIDIHQSIISAHTLIAAQYALL